MIAEAPAGPEKEHSNEMLEGNEGNGAVLMISPSRDSQVRTKVVAVGERVWEKMNSHRMTVQVCHRRHHRQKAVLNVLQYLLAKGRQGIKWVAASNAICVRRCEGGSTSPPLPTRYRSSSLRLWVIVVEGRYCALYPQGPCALV